MPSSSDSYPCALCGATNARFTRDFEIEQSESRTTGNVIETTTTTRTFRKISVCGRCFKLGRRNDAIMNNALAVGAGAFILFCIAGLISQSLNVVTIPLLVIAVISAGTYYMGREVLNNHRLPKILSWEDSKNSTVDT